MMQGPLLPVQGTLHESLEHRDLPDDAPSKNVRLKAGSTSAAEAAGHAAACGALLLGLTAHKRALDLLEQRDLPANLPLAAKACISQDRWARRTVRRGGAQVRLSRTAPIWFGPACTPVPAGSGQRVQGRQWHSPYDVGVLKLLEQGDFPYDAPCDALLAVIVQPQLLESHSLSSQAITRLHTHLASAYSVARAPPWRSLHALDPGWTITAVVVQPQLLKVAVSPVSRSSVCTHRLHQHTASSEQQAPSALCPGRCSLSAIGDLRPARSQPKSEPKVRVTGTICANSAHDRR